MGRVLNTYTMGLDEMPDWIAARGRALHDGCSGCAEERRQKLRRLWGDFASLAATRHVANPKGSNADFEALHRFTRSYVARLTRVLRTPVPARCARHRSALPDGWCAACWPKEARKRAELVDTFEDFEQLAVALERREARQCRHYRRPDAELQTGDDVALPDRPRRYRLDCPLCERIANEAIVALRDEVLDGRSTVEDALELVDLELGRRCEHLVELDPKPERRMDGAPLRRLPFIPDVDHARSLLSSLDEIAVLDAVEALELHMEQLDAEAAGGDGYSLVGMRFNADADAHRTARSSFGQDAAVYVEDITEAEIHVTRHMEQEARVAAQRIYGDSFKGFRHLEGGVADVLMDADVVAARFRFDELIAPFVSTTEERFDVSGMAEIIDRELRSTRPVGAVSLERDAFQVLLPRLRERLALLREWEPAHLSDNEGLLCLDVARDLAAAWADRLSPLELSSCDPRKDGPSLWECLAFPDRVRFRIRMRDDAARERRRRWAVQQGASVPAGLDHAWAWDGEPTEAELDAAWTAYSSPEAGV